LLINKFTLYNFDDTLKSINHLIVQDPVKINDFKNIVKLKELISEWIWYLLTSSVVISVSYNSIMSSKCVKSASQYIDSHNNAMAETSPENPTPDVYTITE
jgi:hypothetical protein